MLFAVSFPQEDSMEIIPWKDDFSVNVQEIDMQHKNLVRMINELFNAMELKKGQEALADIVNRMVKYAGTHFATEERYMLKYDYPGYLEHKAEHDRFVTKAIELQERLNQKSFVVSLEVIRFLKEWLSDHILGTDKKYGPYFNSKGLH